MGGVHALCHKVFSNENACRTLKISFFRTRCICYHINCKFHNMTDLTDFPLDLILAEAIESKIASHLSDASYEGRPPFCGLEENVQTFSHHRWTLAVQKSSERGEKHLLSFSRTIHCFLCRFLCRQGFFII